MVVVSPSPQRPIGANAHGMRCATGNLHEPLAGVAHHEGEEHIRRRISTGAAGLAGPNRHRAGSAGQGQHIARDGGHAAIADDAVTHRQPAGGRGRQGDRPCRGDLVRNRREGDGLRPGHHLRRAAQVNLKRILIRIIAGDEQRSGLRPGATRSKGDAERRRGARGQGGGGAGGIQDEVACGARHRLRYGDAGEVARAIVANGEGLRRAAASKQHAAEVLGVAVISEFRVRHRASEDGHLRWGQNHPCLRDRHGTHPRGITLLVGG